MTTIYLIRHAEAEGNLYRRIHGWYDALITENGFRQIEALQRRFQDVRVDAVWSSDLHRTMTTARAVYVPKGLELHTDPQLRELNFGDWEDQPWGQVYRNEPERIGQFNRTDPAWRAPGERAWRKRAGGPAGRWSGSHGSIRIKLWLFFPTAPPCGSCWPISRDCPPRSGTPWATARTPLSPGWSGMGSASILRLRAMPPTWTRPSLPWAGRPGGGRTGCAGRM